MATDPMRDPGIGVSLKAERRYAYDATYHAFVQTLAQGMRICSLDPCELDEAVSIAKMLVKREVERLR